ncbi:MAG: carboxypeptidase-like regulatory domain-containing protein [Flavobacteriaceae bacterium]|nr:carboxypeptidase-like regulatory domain-containing protein [Flavobacteriaceae bacterium]
MSKNKTPFVFILLFYIFNLNAQNFTVKGIVKDSLQNPLAYANIIAQPADLSKNLKFAITDDGGFYSLNLIKGDNYTVTASYLGYKTASFELIADKDFTKNITLLESPNHLKEVVIELPVTVSEDTITYNTKKFVTGEERKLKDVLKKLPGIEVDKNGLVKVQGKNVTILLVEGKRFFGGDTKLAIDNIPADAIDKVQAIDNYNEVAFLKNVSNSDEMALNILLKENKKQFTFGDIEAGKGNDEYYRTHANLFYYSPKKNINFIGNLNNNGEKIFTYKDYLNFQGGINAILKGDGSLYNISGSDFASFLETQDLIRSENKFGALNITNTINEKWTLSGYAIFSNSSSKTFAQTMNQYTTDISNYREDKESSNATKNILGIGKFKIEYTPNNHEQWYFNTQVKKTDNLSNNTILSIINAENKNIFTTKDAEQFYANQTVEWHKKISKNHTFSSAASYTVDTNNPNTYWKTNQPILQGLIPLINENIYNLSQLKENNRNNLEVVFKYYWVLNPNNHIYTTLGNKYVAEEFYTNDSQQLENNATHNFNSDGFGNDLEYQFNDLYAGIHYKFKTGIVEFKQGAFIHHYQWEVNQLNTYQKNKWVVLPDFLAKIEFTKSKKLQLNYQLKSAFSDAAKLANRFYLQSYNTVFKGNEQLENELFHTARVYYSRFSLYRGLLLFSGINYLKKVDGIQHTVQFENINQYLTAKMISNPEERWDFNTTIDKKIKSIKYRLNINISTADFLQTINKTTVNNKNNNVSYEISAKTLHEKYPTVEVGLRQSFGNYTSSNLKSKYITNEPFVNIDYDFLKGFVLSFDYTRFDYQHKSLNQQNTYELANLTLSYKKENSAWTYKLSAQNLMDVKFKNQNSFSSYIISDSKTYILPRIIMVSLGYNL